MTSTQWVPRLQWLLERQKCESLPYPPPSLILLPPLSSLPYPPPSLILLPPLSLSLPYPPPSLVPLPPLSPSLPHSLSLIPVCSTHIAEPGSIWLDSYYEWLDPSSPCCGHIKGDPTHMCDNPSDGGCHAHVDHTHSLIFII